MKYSILGLLFSILLTNNLISQNNNKLYDSIDYLITLYKDNSIDAHEKLKYSLIADKLANATKNDSIILKVKRDLSYNYLLNSDFETFMDISLENLKLANTLNDSLASAHINKNLGWYYNQIAEDNTLAYKHFIRALKYFDHKKIIKEKAEVLYGIAVIQDNEKDYLGSEINAIEALKLFNKLDYADVISDRYRALNLLGGVSYNLENYEKSIEYHKNALELVEDIQDSHYLYLESQNNLALPYRAKKNFEKSLGIFQNLLKDRRLKNEYPIFYALIKDNYAFTKFLKGDYNYEQLEREFKSALKISDSLDDQYTKLAISIDLAKFYESNKKLDSSLKYAKQSYKLSKEIPINELLLESMRLLANLTKGEESKGYLEAYIKLGDSLLKVERNKRNKFARIEYETDQLEAENEQISKENLYLILLSIGLLLTGVLVYILISQRAKNRKLKLIQVQQKANEDIYNLMLGQQDKVDEARMQEKKRISEELHDGVLGRLFGTRLSLDSINFKDGKEAMMTRANYIGQLKTIEEDIRKISHELNTDFVSGTGFMDIVTELIENQTQAYGLVYDFNYTDDISWDSVSNKTKINIYRIIQESMQNIYKHANAKAIKISISLEKNVICLDIIDDGEGFDTSKNKKGIGLKNMTSRVEDINGKINITSQSGNGTIVNVKIPYSNQST